MYFRCIRPAKGPLAARIFDPANTRRRGEEEREERGCAH